MGWRNPPIPWRELEQRLSDHPPHNGRTSTVPVGADGGDSPAWSPTRPPYVAPAELVPPPPRGTTVPYATRRFNEHVIQFTQLYDDLSGGKLDPHVLADLEARNNLFPDIDYRLYAM